MASDAFEISYNDEGWLIRDFAWAEIWNRLMRPLFDAVPAGKRGIFLPHCMTASEGCVRQKHGIYDVCACCGRCAAAEVVKAAKSKGYNPDHIYIVGGGSALPAILGRDKLEAIVGVACYKEAQLYYNSFTRKEFTIPSQMALLIQWGCRDTKTMADTVLAAL